MLGVLSVAVICQEEQISDLRHSLIVEQMHREQLESCIDGTSVTGIGCGEVKKLRQDLTALTVMTLDGAREGGGPRPLFLEPGLR
jgi:hypothetical protein